MELMVRLLADGTVLAIALIASIYLLLVPNRQKFTVYSHVLMAGLTAYLVSKLIAFVYQPQTLRPFELLGTTPGAAYLNNPGFPSDHALFATALVGAVWLGARRPRVALVLFLLTVAMCVARVVALVHTPIDVVGGVAIATIGFLWYAQMKLPKAKKRPATKA